MGDWQVVVDENGTLPDGRPVLFAGVSNIEHPDDWAARVRDSAYPQLECVGPVGAATAVDVIAELDRVPGWAVRARFEPRDGRLVMTQHEKRQMPPLEMYDLVDGVAVRQPAADHSEHLSQALIRRIGLGSVGTHVKELLTDPLVRVRFLGPGWARPNVRPAHRQREDATYALWANRYVWALTIDPQSPIKAIVQADAIQGVTRTERQVSGMVSRARDRDLLTRPTPDGSRGPTNRAGGELTDRARSLLAELGIAAGSDHIVIDNAKEAS